MVAAHLTRLQHRKFGDELRELLGSAKSEDKEIAGIVVSELTCLKQCRETGQRHPKESRLCGKVGDIEYLSLYSHGYSIRVYYHVTRDVIWMLAIDKNKRVTKLTSEEMLLNRLNEVLKHKATRGN